MIPRSNLIQNRSCLITSQALFEDVPFRQDVKISHIIKEQRKLHSWVLISYAKSNLKQKFFEVFW